MLRTLFLLMLGLAAPGEGIGWDVPPPHVSLRAPADGIRIATDAAGLFEDGRVIATLAWTAKNVRTSHSFLGCLQRSIDFDERRLGCIAAVKSWSGDYRSTAQDLRFDDLRQDIGRTLFWSVRICAPADPDDLNFSCTAWATPRRLVVR